MYDLIRGEVWASEGVENGRERDETRWNPQEDGYGCANSTARGICSGAEDRSRTDDLLITNQLLYQLSYFGLLLRL